MTCFDFFQQGGKAGTVEIRTRIAVVYLNAVFDTMKIGLLRHIMPGKGLITRAFTVQPVHSAAL